MADYQRKVNNSYYLEPSLYKRVLAMIRDYQRQCSEVLNILYGTPEHSGVSGKGENPKPTEAQAIRLATYRNDIDAVRKALESLPEEYRDGVFNNILYGERFEKNASYRTWLRWKQRFIYLVAKNLNLVM